MSHLSYREIIKDILFDIFDLKNEGVLFFIKIKSHLLSSVFLLRNETNIRIYQYRVIRSGGKNLRWSKFAHSLQFMIHCFFLANV